MLKKIEHVDSLWLLVYAVDPWDYPCIWPCAQLHLRDRRTMTVNAAMMGIGSLLHWLNHDAYSAKTFDTGYEPFPEDWEFTASDLQIFLVDLPCQ